MLPHPLHRDCQKVSQILAWIGEKWSMLVVMLLDVVEPAGAVAQHNVAGISQQMLTRTLRGLERDGIVTRTILPTSPPQVEYSLTALGQMIRLKRGCPDQEKYGSRRFCHGNDQVRAPRT